MKTALKLMFAVIGLVVVGLIAGCGTTEMFKDRLAAQGKRDTNEKEVRQAMWSAASQCYKSHEGAAAGGSDAVKIAAMALMRQCAPDAAPQVAAAQQAPLPEVPESGVLTTLRIADTLLGRGISIYGLVSQERIARDGNRTNRDISLGNQAMLGGMFTGQATALSGLGTAGFGALRDLGSTALREVKPAQPNITVTGGVLNTGSGTATLNSGENSGNSGTITKDSPIITNTCGATSGAGANGSVTPPNGTNPAQAANGQGGAGGAANTTCTKG